MTSHHANWTWRRRPLLLYPHTCLVKLFLAARFYILRTSHYGKQRVIVTPAVDLRLVEFLYIDIQSTGQKSHRVCTGRPATRCFVLIRQSDSPGQCQFRVDRSLPDERPYSRERRWATGTIRGSERIFTTYRNPKRGWKPWRSTKTRSRSRFARRPTRR